MREGVISANEDVSLVGTIKAFPVGPTVSWFPAASTALRVMLSSPFVDKHEAASLKSVPGSKSAVGGSTPGLAVQDSALNLLPLEALGSASAF